MKRYPIRFASVAVVLAALVGAAEFGPPILVGQEFSMKDRGPAPEFIGATQWLNSPPLTMSGLQGKAVLVQFWTFTCINWLRTYPYVQKWYDTYKDKGFVVVGVHAPEFSFEHETVKVEASIKRFGIAYPVVQDNEFKIWRAYNNHYWPASFLIDQSGKIVATQIGEGNYSQLEGKIARLVGANAPEPKDDPALNSIGTPEMYAGSARNDGAIVNSQSARIGERGYTAPVSMPLNHYALSGTWKMSGESATLSTDGGEILIKFRAPKVNVVAGSVSSQMLSVTVDGKAQPPVTVDGGRLYTVYDGPAGEHLLRLTVPKAGFSVFSFTFG